MRFTGTSSTIRILARGEAGSPRAAPGLSLGSDTPVPALGSAHDPERARVAPDPEGAAAHDLEKLRAARKIGRETVDFLLARGELDDEAIRRRIEYSAPGAHDVAPKRISLCRPNPELQQDELTLEVLAGRHVLHAHDVHDFVELIDDLLDDRIRAAGDQREARDGRIVSGRNGERLDVVAPRGEESGDPAEGAGLVLQQDGDDVTHARSGVGRDEGIAGGWDRGRIKDRAALPPLGQFPAAPAATGTARRLPASLRRPSRSFEPISRAPYERHRHSAPPARASACRPDPVRCPDDRTGAGR